MKLVPVTLSFAVVTPVQAKAARVEPGLFSPLSKQQAPYPNTIFQPQRCACQCRNKMFHVKLLGADLHI